MLSELDASDFDLPAITEPNEPPDPFDPFDPFEPGSPTDNPFFVDTQVF